ncbi:inositol polyphosphate kinase-domain-containing protein [Kockiozyma suomiensis]|uniref:inositol polyphosphate kinase-domain-containing protein n=1 Tax=Kockiozyma suomiensis TaxID=1337062 RepID=UPI003342EDB5
MEAPSIDLSSAISFDNKVAGHDGVLQDASGSVIIKPASIYEIEFYQQLAASHPAFAKLAPQFYGTLELSEQQTQEDSKACDSATNSSLTHKIKDAERAIVLENATAGFSKPSVIDIKLGRQLWDSRASAEKAARLDAVAAETTSGSLGFRIAGMKVWDPLKDEFVTYDKLYGRKFTKDNILEGFQNFFPEALGSERRTEIIKRILSVIDEMARVLEAEESKMYSASILIVYEGDITAFDEALVYEKMASAAEEESESEEEVELVGETIQVDGKVVERISFAGSNIPAYNNEIAEDDEEIEKFVCKVKIIDFAHATWVPGQGRDTNMLEGIYNTRKIFEKLL